MTDARPQLHRPTAPSWMKILLIASLALNLLVVGTVATIFWRLHRYGPPSPQAFSAQASLFGFATTLPAERRREIWRDTTEHRRNLRALRVEARVARQAVIEQLLSENFDVARFGDAQVKLQDAEGGARAEAQKALLIMVSRLTREERVAFAKWREALPPQARRGGRSPPKPDTLKSDRQ